MLPKNLNIISLSLLLCVVIFIIDVNLPLGIAAAVPYGLAILILAFQNNNTILWGAAVFASVLTIIGLFISEYDTGEMYKILTNRSLALIVIWITAYLAYRKNKLKLKIIETQNNYIKEVEKNLNEKEILFKEVNHRVKNNLQILRSLLSLQALKMDDRASKEALQIFDQRIFSISLIHEQLYSNNSTQEIHVAKFINDLVNNIKSGQTDSKKIIFDLDIEDLNIEMNKAVSIGIIINEIISNSLKYAFPDEEIENKITVKLDRKDSDTHLLIADNGKGIVENSEERRKDSIGTDLIELLTKQIGGIIKCHSAKGKGVVYDIYF